MKKKLTAFAAVVSFFAVAVHFVASPRMQVAASQAADEVLIPSMIGEYQLASRWRNLLGGGRIEAGGSYRSVATHERVQLDVFTEGPATHNGIACYLIRGSSLLRQWLLPVPTMHTGAIFDMAFVVDEHCLRLVAATECYSEYCGEKTLPSGPYWFAPKIEFRLARESPLDMVVPVSITLETERGVHLGHSVNEGAESMLIERFNAFANHLDLAPMRRRAARR